MIDCALDEVRAHIADEMRLGAAAKKLQRAWRECIGNPAYVACRRRLLREWVHDTL